MGDFSEKANPVRKRCIIWAVRYSGWDFAGTEN